MSMYIPVEDIGAAVQRYVGRFKFLHVFSSDVRDLGLCPPSTAPGLHVTDLGEGVLRFWLDDNPSPAWPVDPMPRVCTNLSGIFLGLLVGAVSNGNIQMSRVSMLRYDPVMEQWLSYDGSYFEIAKARLQPRAALQCLDPSGRNP